MKKAQGLPLTTIVVAILVLLVLVMLVVFFTGGFSKIFTSVKGLEPATETDVAAAQAKCSQLCIQAQSLTNPDRWKETGYCTYTNKKDWDGDGEAEEKFCWESPINSFCNAKIGEQALSDKECV